MLHLGFFFVRSCLRSDCFCLKTYFRLIMYHWWEMVFLMHLSFDNSPWIRNWRWIFFMAKFFYFSTYLLFINHYSSYKWKLLRSIKQMFSLHVRKAYYLRIKKTNQKIFDDWISETTFIFSPKADGETTQTIFLIKFN